MNAVEIGLAGVLIIEPTAFSDARGFFTETWNRRRYEEFGIPTDFVQDNLSYLHSVRRETIAPEEDKRSRGCRSRQGHNRQASGSC